MNQGEIESLKAEIERLKVALTPKPPREDLAPHAYEFAWKNAAYGKAEEAMQLRQQLAESQATNAKLREALSYSKKVQEFAKLVMTGAQDRELSLMEKVLWEQTINALSLPNDSTALDAVVAERTKELTAEVERWKNEASMWRQSSGTWHKQFEDLVDRFQSHPNKPVIEQLEKQNAELTAQRDAAMKDAERYRVLRNPDYQLHEDDLSVSDSFFEQFFEEDLDAIVDELKARFDAAIAAQGEKG